MAAPCFASPGDLPRTAGFSHVVVVPAGRQVWVSGQVGSEPDGTTPAGDWEAQTRLAFRNVGRALRSAGADWPQVVKMTVFVVDMAELATVRAVRDEFVDTAAPPASSLLQVAGLVRPELLIEVEAVAHLPGP